MTAAELPAVGRTALGVARVRAAESSRPDRLFDDPYAAEFVAALGEPAAASDHETMTPEQRRWRAGIVVHIVMRTRFYDDYLRDAVVAGCRQVVLLGAGLDTRAWRLEWPGGVRWFEIDLPPVLAAKGSVLAGRRPTCDRIDIAVDLAHDWSPVLRGSGFDPARPTAWLAEGLLVYLDEATAVDVLTRVTELSASGSRIALERADVARTVAQTHVGDRLDEASSLWRGGLGGSPSEWLATHGWQPTEYELVDVAASYGRTVPAKTRSGFVTAMR